MSSNITKQKGENIWKRGERENIWIRARGGINEDNKFDE